jgi:hypothetical protein
LKSGDKRLIRQLSSECLCAEPFVLGRIKSKVGVSAAQRAAMKASRGFASPSVAPAAAAAAAADNLQRSSPVLLLDQLAAHPWFNLLWLSMTLHPILTIAAAAAAAARSLLPLLLQVAADPWFNLPLAADDNDPYANAMASYVAKNLAPGRK